MQIKFNEIGRSMTEMLGVLAIIGVLSVASIMGYKFAMDKYRANDVVYEVNMRATDIWHKFQDKNLPNHDETQITDFPEWSLTTSTGYPIYMVSHPDIAFKTFVKDVSPNVCKNILNMNLNDIIKGIKFVQVAQGNGELIKYVGDTSICGKNKTNNLIVFTSFLETKTNDDDIAQSGDPCVEDADCDSPCGESKCDMDKMICVNECTGTNKPFCFDNGTTGICVKCLVNTDCSEQDQICDLTTNTCVNTPVICGEGDKFGKEYRAANGSCVSCNSTSEIIIINSDENDGIFEKTIGNVKIKDSHSGIEMCNQCQSVKHRVEEARTGENIKTYCATSCVKGNSFLSKEKGCIPCDSLTEISIPDEDQAKAQCLACKNRVWFRAGYSHGYECVLRKCPDGYFKHFGKCRKCVYSSSETSGSNWPMAQDFYSAVLWDTTGYYRFHTSAGSLLNEWSAECLNCSKSTDPNLQATYQVAAESNRWTCTDICGRNQFQNSVGTCYDCDTDSVPGLGTSYGKWLEDLCTACTPKREVRDGKCVKINNPDCSKEEVLSFLGSDDKCHPCDSEGRIHVLTDSNKDGTDDYGGCTTICGEDRFLIDNYCYKKCADKQVMNYSGTCKNCSDIGLSFHLGNGTNYTVIDDLCRTACGKGTHDVYQSDYRYCAPTDCGEGRLHSLLDDYGGVCDKCPTESSKTLNVRTDGSVYKTECEACGNHIFINKHCVYYNPGISGVCNNDSPNTTKYPNHSAGIGILYRDNSGVCRPCDDASNSYAATETECNSCVVNGIQIRRVVSGYCVYGGCTEGETFRTTSGCTNCDTDAVKIETLGQDAKLLCNSCNRRIMTTGSAENSTEKMFCVPKCASEEWQDINGDCWHKTTNVDDNEIGTDDLSWQLCLDASRTPVKNADTGQVYCN